MSDELIKNRIRELRFFNGEMSQQQLAERCECTRQTIIALEKGRYTPSLVLAFRIAAALNEPIESVFIYEDATAKAPDA